MSDLDLSDYLSDDALILRGVPSAAHPAAEGGGSYSIPSLSAADGVRLQRFLRLGAVPGKDATAKQRTAYAKDAVEARTALQEFTRDADGNDVEFIPKLFGSAYQQMLDDGVSHNVMEKLAQIVTTQVTAGFDMAERVVSNAVGEAKARAAQSTTGSQPTAPDSSQPDGSKSSAASSAKSTPATRAQASTPASKTSARKPAKRQARKTA